MPHPVYRCRSARLLAVLLAMLGPITGGSQAIKRVPNTTLRFPAEPPNSGYRTVDAFPGAEFFSPTAMAVPPGETNRLFVLERGGTMTVINNLASPQRSLFLDLRPRGIGSEAESGLLGLAFHPGFATNGYFFVFYTLGSYTSTQGTGIHHRLARFQAIPPNAPSADLSTERPLITQLAESGYHCGGDLHFGPDGYLYVGVGDEGPGGDNTYRNSQRIDKDFFSGIMRLDVDSRPENLQPNPHPAQLITNALPYRIPVDNPWVGATSFVGLPVDPAKVRTEFYAVGLRNPWRMNFDPRTGILYCGEVGEWDREEINIIVKGGNYGWAFREGSLVGPRPDAAPAGTPSIAPIHEYQHGSTGSGVVFNSVIGGVVYRGPRLPQLQGFYVFGDYMSGNIWALRYDGEQARDFQQLMVETSVSSYGVDPRNQDLLLCNLREGRIKRLLPVEPTTDPGLPTKLSETGAFQDLQSLTVQPGIVPYSINDTFWSDHAEKHRWFSVPDTNASFTFNTNNHWLTTPGSVWIKHFEMVTNEVTQAKRRLETRFIVKGSNGVYGATYRWNSNNFDATLVSAEGATESIAIHLANGRIIRQQWQYPSRSACLACHTPVTGGNLGFGTAQLNRDLIYPSGIQTNQLGALAEAGYFGNAVPPPANTLPRLVSHTNATVSLEYRVRSYLDANCSSCHRPGGAAPTDWDARFSNPTDGGNSGHPLINAVLKDDLGNPLNRTLVPGHPELSMFLQRTSVRGSIQMPPLASSELDTSGIQLLLDWIQSDELRLRASFESWQGVFFDPADPRAKSEADPDGDGQNNQQEFLAGTNPLDATDRLDVSLRVEGGRRFLQVVQPANRSLTIEFKDSLDPKVEWKVLPESNDLPRFPLLRQTHSFQIEENLSKERYFRARVQSL